MYPTDKTNAVGAEYAGRETARNTMAMKKERDERILG
jgi:hypothetical protein